MATKRKNYTAAQKAAIALEAIKGNKTMSELSCEYSVNSTQIHNWKTQLKNGVVDIFSTKRGRKKAEDIELIERLYNQIGQLTVELDWIKKKSELFK